MKNHKFSAAEWAAVAVALGLVLFMAGWFARGAVSAPDTFTVSASHPSSAPAPSSTPQVFVPDEAVDLNSADLSALTTLPGIGESKAQAILDYRAEHGPFRYVEDITKVSGIGRSTFENLKDYITVKEVAP